MSADTTSYTEHIFEHHGGHGLPPLRRYMRRVWQGRTYLYFRTRAELKAQHFDSWFGQLWVVLNPMLLALVYWLLFTIIRRSSHGFDFLTFLVGGLFAYYFTRNSGQSGATSVTAGGNLIANTTLPRVLLPMSSVLTALLLFLPGLAVYGVMHVFAGFPVGGQLLALIPLLAIQIVFNLGLALALSTVTVYFRDTSSFLPYLFRLLLYLSPVLYRFDEIRGTSAAGPAHVILRMNPLYPILESWHQVLSDGRWPDQGLFVMALLWAVGSLLLGGWLFLSRERDFAVRV